MIIDATNLVLGRLASFAAKKALQGETVHIINSEKAIISGDKHSIGAHYKQRRERGEPFHGPFYPRRSDLLIKRAIRGMLPYKQGRGKEALGRIRCFISVPKGLQGKKAETLKQANVSNLQKTTKYITIAELSKYLGAGL